MTAASPARPLVSVLESSRELVAPALQDAVRRYLSPRMGQVASYHHGWSDADGRPTGRWGGKLVRPALALLSARAAGHAQEAGVPAAVAVELVHNFSLLHDDIMDDDTKRRGRATAWTVFGVPNALLAGDALLTAATSVLLDSDGADPRSATAWLMTATQRMITGQTADIEFERRGDVTLAECVRMAGDKTGALLSCACSLGAALVGADTALVDRLAAFGEHVGLAFQLVDDLLGIWGDPATTGKAAGADLVARKKSLPVVAALQAASSTELWELYSGEEPLTEAEVARAAALVERDGGRDWALTEAARQIDAARECLAAADVPRAVGVDLAQVASFVVGREF
ncbi:polyprenyl synthetase family protein [Lentzea sp. NPDC059081]|uniref:polyprenyl synthetase family protein n=1 Tax=Lentzea sp. NPDC059081 TaxID=3346719 RepID=UPI0036905F0A